MANDNATPIRRSNAGGAAPKAGNHVGTTPELHAYLAHAAAVVRKAVAATERASASTSEGSDAEMQCADVLEHLAEALRRLE